MGWGDEIVAAGQAQRLYDADPSRRVSICDVRGFPRWHSIWDGNPILATPDDVLKRREPVQQVISGPHCRPYIVYPFTSTTGWTFNTAFRCRDHIARLYLTPHELQRGTSLRAQFGPYVLIEPFTKHENFRWPLARWQQLVAACPDLTFIQHLHPDSPAPLPGVYGVTASFREACGLIAAADLYVRSESGLCHAAAALGRPQVTLFGGCMDPDVMGGYPLQTVIADRGAYSPCGRWQRCEHCLAAMSRLAVEDVQAALRLTPRAEVAA